MGWGPHAAGKVIAVAIVANLLFVGAGALVVAPVDSSRVALGWYDGLPRPVRTLLGDEAGTGNGSADRTAGSALDVEGRGPVGQWLADLYRAAVEGDPDAQLALPLAIAADVPADAWIGRAQVNLTWPVHGAGITYRVAVTPSAEAPAFGPGATTALAGAAVVTLEPGTSYVHVQALRGGKTGPVATLGPLRVDLTPPPAPFFSGGTAKTVDDVNFVVDWAPVLDDSGIVGYRLETSRNGADFTPYLEFPGQDTQVQERNRPKGDYWYRVRAVNGAGLVSEPSPALRVTVDVQLETTPGLGRWHYGINATYDSVLHLYDIQDTSQYLTLGQLAAAGHGGLTNEAYARYTGAGAAITLDDPVLGAAVNERIAGETNSMRIAMKLFELLFNQTDYDFDKLAATATNFQDARETWDTGLGICGDLTALYVTLLRIAGVPARPVHGYLINRDVGDQGFGTIGGFHMWAEVYVGGNDPTGGGWIPVDVSGVTGEFKREYLAIYFAVANPNYLQLGVQDDLGSATIDSDGDGDAANDDEDKWNVWAKLGWRYPQNQNPPPPSFDADAYLDEDVTKSTTGRIWFDGSTLARVFCADDQTGCGASFSTYFDGVKGRSVRTLDYGADLSWDSGVLDLELRVKFPEQTAPTQVVLYTVYERSATCTPRLANPPAAAGFFDWAIDGDDEPCSAG